MEQNNIKWGLPINFGKNVKDLPKTVKELAKELNVTEKTIRNTAKKLGINDKKSTFRDQVQKSVPITSHGKDTGKTRTISQVAFTKADADMISATLSVHHNLKDNSVVMNNTKEMLTKASFNEAMGNLPEWLQCINKMELERINDNNRQATVNDDIDRRLSALTPVSSKPLNERWYSSIAIYNLYPEARKMFNTPKGLSRALYKYAELNNFAVVRQRTGNNGYQYHEFRADFVEGYLSCTN